MKTSLPLLEEDKYSYQGWKTEIERIMHRLY